MYPTSPKDGVSLSLSQRTAARAHASRVADPDSIPAPRVVPQTLPGVTSKVRNTAGWAVNLPLKFSLNSGCGGKVGGDVIKEVSFSLLICISFWGFLQQFSGAINLPAWCWGLFLAVLWQCQGSDRHSGLQHTKYMLTPFCEQAVLQETRSTPQADSALPICTWQSLG